MSNLDRSKDGAPSHAANRDALRTVVLLFAVCLQTVAGALGGSGALGEPVGAVANAYPTLVLPSGEAFTIWSLIYAAILALAVRAALPGQRSRTVHRRTGWWLAASALLNAAWIVVFTQRWFAVAETVIVALLVALGVVLVKLSSCPAEGWTDRLLLHTPVGVYLGWVSVATVAGAATTGAALGIAPEDSTAVALAAVAIVGTAAGATVVAYRVNAAAGYIAAVAWALVWIAAATPAWPVAAAAVAGSLAAVSAVGWRFWRGQRPSRTAWG